MTLYIVGWALILFFVYTRAVKNLNQCIKTRDLWYYLCTLVDVIVGSFSAVVLVKLCTLI